MKKLCVSEEDKMLCGVCGGIAEYLNVDTTIVRILVVLFTLCGGSGVMLYIIAAILMPRPYE